MEHSKYSPSRLSRIINCPGSVNLIDALMDAEEIERQQPQSSYASHGTMLHSVMCKYYKINPGVHNEKALDGLEIDDKYLIQEAAEYLDILLKSKGHTVFEVGSEMTVNLESWGVPDVYGTLDFKIYDPMKRHMDVIDWKFGSGIPVYAKENPQLMAYAGGAVKWPTTTRSVTLHVVQPALENYSTWDLTIIDLYNWIHGTLAIAINKCESDVPKFNPGVEQCRWCEGKNHCPARTNFVQEQAVKIFAAKEMLASTPSIEELVKILKLAPLVESALKGIAVFLQTELERGRKVPGMKLVRGRSNRAWKNETDAVTWLAKNTQIEELFTSKLKSPSAIEKEARAVKNNENFKALYENPPGKITLTTELDKRPAVQTESSAIDVFKDCQVPDKLE